MLLRGLTWLVLFQLLGTALNAAHGDIMFKQLGVRPRRESVETLARSLRAMGKVVIIESY